MINSYFYPSISLYIAFYLQFSKDKDTGFTIFHSIFVLDLLFILLVCLFYKIHERRGVQKRSPISD